MLKMDFQQLVKGELEAARTKHAKPINSLHEGYAVLLEEVDEVKQEVFWGGKATRTTNTLAELVQVAAMAQRMAEDCNLI